MAVAHNTVLFDVHDFKVYPMTSDTGASPVYGAAVDVVGISQVSMDPNIIAAELKGDARVIAKRGRVDKFTMSATYGKLNLDVLAVIMQGTVTDQTTVSSTFTMLGANTSPYFRASFKISDLDTGIGDLHVNLFKCLLTGGTLISGQTDNFGQPTLQLEAIPLASTDKLLEVMLYAAATSLPL